MISFLKSHGPFLLLICFALVLFVFLIVVVVLSSVRLTYLPHSLTSISLTPRFSVPVPPVGMFVCTTQFVVT
jgi:hypothetical protein